ncbi:MAG: helix-hairpin-helix domain-containing protein [Candidatus Sericytochromatia bacterium]
MLKKLFGLAVASLFTVSTIATTPALAEDAKKMDKKVEAKKEDKKADKKMDAKKEDKKADKKMDAKKEDKKADKKMDAKKEDKKADKKMDAKKEDKKADKKMDAKKEDKKADKKMDAKKMTSVNINKATEAELKNLPGVGDVVAKAIVEHRKKNGNFKKIEDLKAVKGIGDKTFEGMKKMLAL